MTARVDSCHWRGIVILVMNRSCQQIYVVRLKKVIGRAVLLLLLYYQHLEDDSFSREKCHVGYWWNAAKEMGHLLSGEVDYSEKLEANYSSESTILDLLVPAVFPPIWSFSASTWPNSALVQKQQIGFFPIDSFAVALTSAMKFDLLYRQNVSILY